MTEPQTITPEDVITFWMEAGPDRWFAKSEEFDTLIRERFGALLATARERRLDGWAGTRVGRLGKIILLDQFSRNIHRDSPLAFASDGRALTLARVALNEGDFVVWPKEKAQWLLLPFEHHEGMDEQDTAVELATRLGDPELIRYAEIHRDIIRQYGRFPHRNAVLGRATTTDEQQFLDNGGFKG